MNSEVKVAVTIILSTLVLIVGSIWLLTKGGSQNTNIDANSPLVSMEDLVKPNSVVMVDPGDSTIATIVEFSDFQCPACKAANPGVEALMTSYPGQIKLVYRHFPLDAHRWAKLAAQAAEAALLQGKFNDMHDMLFDRQQEWSVANDPKFDFKKYAEELGLNADQFMSDLESSAVTAKVQSDLTAAISLNVTATPTFFVNGKRVTGFDMKTMISLIEVAVSQQNQAEASASTSGEVMMKSEPAL